MSDGRAPDPAPFDHGAVTVPTANGAWFDAWRATPAAPTSVAVVVLQEIFGVTRKIRGYCDMFAARGYRATVCTSRPSPDEAHRCGAAVIGSRRHEEQTWTSPDR